MKIDVGPLLDAIDRYIAKADSDLEENLSAEGYVGAAKAVQLAGELEEAVNEALEKDAKEFLKRIQEAAGVETFISDIWPQIKDADDLEKALRKIFREQFNEMFRSFTYEWMLAENPVLAGIDEEITKPSEAFIKGWSGELARRMKLSTKDSMERMLLKAQANGWFIDQLAEAIGDSGIRNPGYRSRRVALTEMLRVQSYAQQESMIQNPLCYKKKWKHVMSKHPRENHMSINGQEVFKREFFELPGAQGGTYQVMCPRDTGLPASETVNCHCLMEAVCNENALGMSKEELAELRRKAMDEVNAEYDAAHATDTVDMIKSMEYDDQVRYFGGKDGGRQRLALVNSGVISTDKELEKLYKIGADGKRERKSLQELADDGIFTVSDKILEHSVNGTFTGASKMYPNGRMASGGHSQAAMANCDAKGIEYTVNKTFSNGVRIGNVPTSKLKIKQSGNGQAWFPETWEEDKILVAGTAIANNGEPLIEGYHKTGVFDGVAVRVLMEKGNISTICPDLDQDMFVKGVV
ncbi:hypothetical protein D7Y41_28190 [Anaerotruncus sp. 1XD22-93]|nr:hypothetical protein [Lachnospiraceae bacterium]NBI76589.1 hypothetical protein [Lachnospiraceae bacterium]RKJ79268.1 hypothetical protein D7Y41_28190 [Anaerotruncus sp. 1XD22-93]